MSPALAALSEQPFEPAGLLVFVAHDTGELAAVKPDAVAAVADLDADVVELGRVQGAIAFGAFVFELDGPLGGEVLQALRLGVCNP